MKKLNYFKIGIGWAIFASFVMLAGALNHDKFPQGFEYFYDKGGLGILVASFFYIVANFIIFTFPAFLVYKSGELSNKQKKITANNKLLAFFKKTIFFLKNVIPIIIVFLALYLIAAGYRGDIFTDSLSELTDYGYCIGVIVTAMLFGFRDLKDVEDTQQKHDSELSEMKRSLSEYEAKYKKMKNRYTEMRNKGKRELAKLEKKYQLEDSQNEFYVQDTIAKIKK
ncbi:hypothetical protein [Lysinibacillus sp.]|uniref:hypothetical protein n=1 Tax=Lysinibacillus sp. TaxID=1869345 RepID=UPI0028991CCE|nr:hypothetical protein [Lysinibacillus sp.]